LNVYKAVSAEFLATPEKFHYLLWAYYFYIYFSYV
jgi:hypothetical protein